MKVNGIDNRETLRKLNSAVYRSLGVPYGGRVEIEDLSHSIIQILGFEGCTFVEKDPAINEYGYTGIPRLINMLFWEDVKPDVSESILGYFTEYDPHKMNLLKKHVREFKKKYRQAEAQEIFDKLDMVMGA